MARVVAVIGDLMFGSKVVETLRSAGHDVTLVPRLAEAELEGTDLIVADLEQTDADALAGPGIPVLGFYPHAEVQIKERAVAAGIALAVPRSRVARELPALADSVLSGR